MDIASMTTAMKARAKAAIELADPQGEVVSVAEVPEVTDEDGNITTAAVPAVMVPDPGWAPNYTTRTPRQLRALILHEDDSDAVRAAMTSEGWFIAATATDADGKLTFAAASNQAVDVS